MPAPGCTHGTETAEKFMAKVRIIPHYIFFAGIVGTPSIVLFYVLVVVTLHFYIVVT